MGIALLLAACTPPAPQLGALLVDIAGLPVGVDANVTVTGPDAFSRAVAGTELLGDLSPGDYTVAAGTITTTAVTEYTPVDASVNVAVAANQTATATVLYSTTLGSLQIDVTGLAPDASAAIVVTGPNGFSATLNGAATLTGLAPGTYDLSAETVRSNSPIVDSIFDVSAIDASVEVDSGATAGATVDYEKRPGSGAVWVPANFVDALISIGSDKMGATNSDAADTIVTGTANFVGLAFDANGDAWTAADDSGLFKFTSEQLASSGAPTPAVTITSDGASVLSNLSLAFDSGGNLWVANAGASRLEMFTPAQLATDGSPTPTIVRQNDGGSIVSPTGIAFDAGGNLWVGNAGNDTVVGFSPAQIAASGAPTPFATISDNGGSLTSVRYLTFDVDGNLWVSNALTDTISKYTPAQQVTGAPVPNVVITGDGTHLEGPEGMLFDNSGNLWVATFSDTLERLTTAQLASTGSPVPGVILSGLPDLGFSQPAFYPPASGLPLNTP